MRKQVEAWLRSELTDVTAKVVIYEAFVEGKLEAPKDLAGSVRDFYFEPLSTRNFGRGRSSVCRMPSLRHLKSSIRFPGSRRPPNSVNSSKPGFHSRSSPWGGVGQPPLLVDELAGVAWRFDVSVDRNEDIRFRLTGVSARDVNLQGETTPVCGTQITKLAVADRYHAKLQFPNVRVWKDRTAKGAGQCRGLARRRLPQRSR
jgi:hypothetical protein